MFEWAPINIGCNLFSSSKAAEVDANYSSFISAYNNFSMTEDK